MSRYIGRVAKDTTTDNVHRFRTNSRRVEVLVAEFVPDNGNKKKLLKVLSKTRKKAGKVRDLDVQIAFLKELRVPDRQQHRSELLARLEEEQARRTRKLAKSFDPKKVRELRKRLRRAQAELTFQGLDPLQLALGRLPKPSQVPLTEKTLHSCRIAAKQARYLAELAGNSPEATLFVEQLKRAQDAIGEWHDIVKLQEHAEERFGRLHDSALVSAVQNITRARFRRAVNAITTALAALSQDVRPAPSETSQRKTAEPAPQAQSAVA